MTEKPEKKTKPAAEQRKPAETKEMEDKPSSEQAESHLEQIQQKAAYVEAERLAKLKEELQEVELRIDRKVQDFKKFVDDTSIQGQSLAGAAVQEMSEEEKSIAAAKKLLEGTGLEKEAGLE